MIEVHRIQHAVGQGGFHSCMIRFAGSRFRYVYDCGSTNPAARDRELDAFDASFQDDEPLDLLLLSHLDDDHVNGVDRLLARRDARVVVIPYLQPWERLALIMEACERGTLTESHFDLIESPVRWFLRRGTNLVVVVLPTIGHEDGDPPRVRLDPPEGFHPWRPQEPKEMDRDVLKPVGWGPLSEQQRDDYPELKRLEQGLGVLQPGEPVWLCSDRSLLAVWMLIPFTHPEPERLKSFQSLIKRELRLPLPTGKDPERYVRRIRTILKDKQRRAELARAYGVIRADRNLTSMSLYSGPAHGLMPVGDGTLMQRRLFRHHSLHHSRRSGWLGTGDAVLTRANRARAFEHFFEPVLSEVGTFMLPHHGSSHNFAGYLLREHLNGVLWIAAYGKRNTYGHPDRSLIHALKRRGEVARVTQRSSSLLEERLRLR